MRKINFDHPFCLSLGFLRLFCLEKYGKNDVSVPISLIFPQLAMKNFFIPLCFVFAASLYAAEEAPWYNPDAAIKAICGTVVDETGKPVPDIRIVECGVDEPASVHTDENGNYTFPPNRTRRAGLLAENADRSLLGFWLDRTTAGKLNPDTTIVLKPVRTITGTVKNEKGEPIAEAQIIATTSMSEVVRTQSDSNGEFLFQYPADVPMEAILALKNGVGFDYIWTLEAPTDDEYRAYGSEGNPAARKKSDGPFALTLDGVKPVRFQCVDDSGEPLAGVEIHPWLFSKPGRPDHLNVGISQYKRTADADGNVVFDFFPTWEKTVVTFWAGKKGFLNHRIDLSPENFERINTVKMRKAIVLRGTLRLPDGTPVEQWSIYARGDDEFIEHRMTDDQGRYEIMVPPNRNIHLSAQRSAEISVQEIEKDWIAVPKWNLATGNDPIFVQDITLEKGTRIFGTATAGPDKEPASGAYIVFWRQEKNEDAAEGEEPFRNVTTGEWRRIETDGTYEFWLTPGHYELRLQSGGAHFSEPQQIAVEQGVEQTVDFHTEKRKVQTARKIRGKALFGTDPTNTVPGVSVSFRSYDWQIKGDLKTDEKGEFEILARNDPVYVEAMTPGDQFGRVVIVQPDEEEFTVSLEPTASVRGKLIDSRSEKPPVGRSVTYSINIPDSNDRVFSTSFERETKTNENGEYELRNLPTGVSCHINLPKSDYGEIEPSSWAWIGRELELKPAEDRQLKDFTFDSRPNGFNEYSFQVYNAYYRILSEGQNRIERRFEILCERAKRDGKGVFAILVRDKAKESDLDALSNIYVTLFGDDDMFAQTERYYMMCVLMQPKEDFDSYSSEVAREFVQTHKIAEPLPSLFSIAFFDADGNLRGVEPFDHTVSLAKQKQNLIEMLEKY